MTCRCAQLTTENIVRNMRGFAGKLGVKQAEEIDNFVKTRMYEAIITAIESLATGAENLDPVCVCKRKLKKGDVCR